MVELGGREIDVKQREPMIVSQRIDASGQSTAKEVLLRRDREDSPRASVEQRRTFGSPGNGIDLG